MTGFMVRLRILPLRLYAGTLLITTFASIRSLPDTPPALFILMEASFFLGILLVWSGCRSVFMRLPRGLQDQLEWFGMLLLVSVVSSMMLAMILVLQPEALRTGIGPWSLSLKWMVWWFLPPLMTLLTAVSYARGWFES